MQIGRVSLRVKRRGEEGKRGEDEGGERRTNLELLDENFAEEFLDWDVVLLGCWRKEGRERGVSEKFRRNGRKREKKRKPTNPKRR